MHQAAGLQAAAERSRQGGTEILVQRDAEDLRRLARIMHQRPEVPALAL
jgi:hypothetical protein